MTAPNIILINCDDLGYGDLGAYGSRVNKTPAIDRMAAEGMRFTDFYMASPVCSPSRGALMTGCYPPRISFGSFVDGGVVLFPGDGIGLNPDEITAIYLKVSNSGNEAVTLVGVEAEWADEVAFHQTAERGGLLVMEHMMTTSVPAGGSLVFEPGGMHLMAQNLHQTISEGDELELDLVTNSGDRIHFAAIASGLDGLVADDADAHHLEMGGDSDAMDVEAHGAVFASVMIPPGKSFEFTFDHSFEEVVVPDHDHLTGTSGTIMVMDNAEAGDAVDVRMDEQGFQPTDLHVSPGTVVTWTNETDVAWTVINGHNPGS